jgi:hypothetical protein
MFNSVRPNESLSKAKQAINNYIQANYISKDRVREAIGENYIFDRLKEDYLPNTYHFLKGKNDLRDDLKTKLEIE